jgi:acyl-CoA thioesterase FadM
MNIFDLVTKDLNKTKVYDGEEIQIERTWSYGDVENNGVYYHPQLTHYAHQAFEEFFNRRVGFHYVDLSRISTKSNDLRTDHVPPIPRMTFPVEWLFQWMYRPMYAGEQFRITIDTVKISSERIGVRAWVYNEPGQLTAAVIWIRAALELDPDRRPVQIPDWFPRK